MHVSEEMSERLSEAGFPAKKYIGDGAYVEFDGYSLIVTTSDGCRDTNRIALEPEVYASLVEYQKKVETTRKAISNQSTTT